MNAGFKVSMDLDYLVKNAPSLVFGGIKLSPVSKTIITDFEIYSLISLPQYKDKMNNHNDDEYSEELLLLI